MIFLVYVLEVSHGVVFLFLKQSGTTLHEHCRQRLDIAGQFAWIPTMPTLLKTNQKPVTRIVSGEEKGGSSTLISRLTRLFIRLANELRLHLVARKCSWRNQFDIRRKDKLVVQHLLDFAFQHRQVFNI